MTPNPSESSHRGDGQQLQRVKESTRSAVDEIAAWFLAPRQSPPTCTLPSFHSVIISNAVGFRAMVDHIGVGLTACAPA
jgi:hypothetical protein